MNFENILITTENGIGQVTINRPSKLNALNKVTIQELHDAFENLEKDENVRVIIITGEGEKAFVAGADISEFANFSVEEGAQLAAQGQELLFDFVQNLSTFFDIFTVLSSILCQNLLKHSLSLSDFIHM